MRVSRMLFAVSTTLVLAACSTPYGSYGLLGGYSEAQLADNVWQVTFEGNGYTRRASTVKMTMLRCAELTLEQGYKYFAIIDKGAYSTNAGALSNGNFSGTATTIGNTTNFSGSTGGLAALISYPTADQTIMMFKEKPEGVLSYSAEITCTSLGKELGVTCSTLKPKTASGKNP